MGTKRENKNPVKSLQEENTLICLPDWVKLILNAATLSHNIQLDLEGTVRNRRVKHLFINRDI